MKVAIKQLLDDSEESVEQFKKEIETMRHVKSILIQTNRPRTRE
jgi:hypothetical protein